MAARRGRPPKQKTIAEELRGQVHALDEEIKSIKENGGPATAIASLFTLRTRLLGQLAAISGEREVSETQILRSRAWIRLQRVITDTLAPWPDALRTLGETLLQFKDDGQ